MGKGLFYIGVSVVATRPKRSARYQGRVLGKHVSLQRQYCDIAPSDKVSVGAVVFALETKLGWRKAIIVIVCDYVHLCIVQIGINVFAMNEHIHAGWNSSGCVTVIDLVDHFVLRRLPHLSFSEDLHQYLESYGAPKFVALLGGESHFG
jgi:hypothetical protein